MASILLNIALPQQLGRELALVCDVYDVCYSGISGRRYGTKLTRKVRHARKRLISFQLILTWLGCFALPKVVTDSQGSCHIYSALNCNHYFSLVRESPVRGFEYLTKIIYGSRNPAGVFFNNLSTSFYTHAVCSKASYQFSVSFKVSTLTLIQLI